MVASRCSRPPVRRTGCTTWLLVAVLAAGELEAGQGVGFSNIFSLDLRQITAVLESGEASASDQPQLAPFYPNPFNSVTTLDYLVPASRSDRQEVRISLYSVSGQLVRSLVAGNLPSGRHTAHWDGRSDSGERVGSGVYIASMRVGSVDVVRKVLLLQ